MFKNLQCFFLIIYISFFLCFFANKDSQAYLNENKAKLEILKELNENYINLKVSHFLIILDASISMCESSQGYVKFEEAKDIIKHINEVLPDKTDVIDFNKKNLEKDDININYLLKGGIITFGHPEISAGGKVEVVQPIIEHLKQNINDLISNNNYLGTCNGESPLDKAIDHAKIEFNKILKESNNTKNHFALIIISDWKEMNNKPKEQLQILKNNFKLLKENICIYPIFVGYNPVAFKHMQSFFKGLNNECCTYLNTDHKKCCKSKKKEECFDKENKIKFYEAGNLKNDEDMKIFVENIFFQQTLYEVIEEVDDPCKNKNFNLEINFDFEKAVVKPEYYTRINMVVKALNNCDQTFSCIEIQGHTCNLGKRELNQRLSHNRAKAVYEEFIKRGIKNPEKFTYNGYADTIRLENVSLITEDGRKKHRRVILKWVDPSLCSQKK